MDTRAETFVTRLLARRWLSKKSFEIKLKRPSSFDFKAGQRIRLIHGTVEREYSLACAPADPELVLCIRCVAGGQLSPELSMLPIGSRLDVGGPVGYFTFKSSLRPAVFVATGTGIAPFRSIVRAGVKGFTLLHGVRTAADLYYAVELRSSAKSYVPCLSAFDEPSGGFFQGRVTAYLEKELAAGRYDFYLCGRREMIRDATLLVDERFPGSLVYAEIFYQSTNRLNPDSLF